ncbi:arsenate reductase/protein-tyrosine-phosphatase family protein [Microlunatus parietis]|uniref:Protein-tyrosine-phosphatase/DNA-binding transcriptional ArsR family regulator n=1 Tax=Microlunatus parietis TaxID=682979 RepID=A0A7Y9IEL1_9ACTN|nr:ArsR family transcriptional regulator [Microlunatus parietis]NYE75292.1 protein-tyrosine-phosphatase/DNA-binding transcriptional ArsR family regulator [Microlunatus parietis]
MVSTAAAPPPFLGLVAHPLRWSLLTTLGRSDLRVRELTELVGEPQNLVSYHLALLRRAGLVEARRSSFDGRDSYYRLELQACAEALAHVGSELHPALRPAEPATGGRRRAPVRVLFTCTGNSARSPMAAALLRQQAGDRVQVHSAGSRPRPLDPRTVKALRRYDLDLAGHRPQSLDRFAGRRLHHVISLCDKVREELPGFTHQPELRHWSIANPADADDQEAFDRTAAELDLRVRQLVPALLAP